MANSYRNSIDVVATTNIKTVYTCPAETVALVKSISAYNAHGSTAADWTLTLYDSDGNGFFHTFPDSDAGTNLYTAKYNSEGNVIWVADGRSTTDAVNFSLSIS